MTQTRLTIEHLKNGFDALERQWTERRKQEKFEVHIVIPARLYDTALECGVIYNTGYMGMRLEGHPIKVIRGEKLPE